MEFYLEKVKESEKQILYRLLQYSLFEESLNDGNQMNSNAEFDYKYFEKYFSENNRIAFIIKEKDTNKILGFVMINKYLQKFECGHSIAEFMIVPYFRRNHIGMNVAKECFNSFKGNWEVKPACGSKVAFKFWNKVISDYTNQNFKFEDGLFLFNNE